MSFAHIPGFCGVTPTPAGSPAPVVDDGEYYSQAQSPLLAASEEIHFSSFDDGYRAPASSPVSAESHPPKRSLPSPASLSLKLQELAAAGRFDRADSDADEDANPL